MNLVGKEKFVKALAKYHAKFKHSNARTEDWLDVMEKETGFDIKPLAKQWLKQTGYPTLEITSNYENGKLFLNYKQKNQEGKKWSFLFRYAGFNTEGKKIFEDENFIKDLSGSIEIETENPYFLSLNRGLSFFGEVNHSQSRDQLKAQYEYDDDFYARFMAWYELTDQEKTKLLNGEQEEVSQDIVDLYWNKFSDEELMMNVGTSILVNFEFVKDKKFSYDYDALFQVRKKISTAVAKQHKEELFAIYKKFHNRKSDNPDYMQRIIEDGKSRAYKNTALALLSRLDTPDVHALMKEQYYSADNGSDKMSSFSMIIDSSMDDKEEVLEHYEKEAVKDLVKWEGYIAMIARSEGKDVVKLLKRIEKHDNFRIDQANDQRAAYLVFSFNKRQSFQTEEGREFLRDGLLKISTLNEYTTGVTLSSFGEIDKMDKKYHTPLVQIMVDVLRNVTEEKQPSVYKTIIRMLISLKEAVKTYTEEKGEIKELIGVSED